MGFDDSVAAKEVANLDKLKVFLTSASGIGKTQAGARFGERPFIALTELQGMRTIMHANPSATIFHNKEGRPGVRDFDDIVELVRMFSDPRMLDYDSFVLDSLEDMMDKIKKHYEKVIPADAGDSKDKKGLKRWGLIIDKTNSILRQIRDLPTHVLVTCLDHEVEDGGSLVHRPALYGKTSGFPGKVVKYFNLVGFGYKRPSSVAGEMHHSVIFSGPEKYLTKPTPGIRSIEPLEPMHWISKTIGGDVPDDVAKRVEAWQEEEDKV